MDNKPGKFRINWFWGLAGCLGILGFMLEEPAYYAFFSFFLFFITPFIGPSKNRKT